jgi:uncharacterized protein (TIGR03089 family)
MPTLLDAFDDLVSADPARPLLTWYRGDARVELSRATVANWVAKTAGLLDHELLIGPGSKVRIVPSRHWLSLVVPLAVWRVGAAIVEDGPADLLVSDLVTEDVDAADLMLLPDDAFGLSRAPAPAPWQLFAELVQAQPDRYPATPVTDEQLAFATAPLMTHQELIKRARTDAVALGLPQSGRLLLVATEPSEEPLRYWCATIADSGSLILADKLTQRLTDDERPDVTIS